MSSRSSATHIPFRESKLTRLLAESLGEDGNTVLVATVDSGSSAAQETLATLKCAELARNMARKEKKTIEVERKGVKIGSPHPVTASSTFE